MGVQLGAACRLLTWAFSAFSVHNDVKSILAAHFAELTDHFCSHFLDDGDITEARSAYLRSPGHAIPQSTPTPPAASLRRKPPLQTAAADYLFQGFFLKDREFAEIPVNCCTLSDN